MVKVDKLIDLATLGLFGLIFFKGIDAVKELFPSKETTTSSGESSIASTEPFGFVKNLMPSQEGVATVFESVVSPEVVTGLSSTTQEYKDWIVQNLHPLGKQQFAESVTQGASWDEAIASTGLAALPTPPEGIQQYETATLDPVIEEKLQEVLQPGQWEGPRNYEEMVTATQPPAWPAPPVTSYSQTTFPYSGGEVSTGTLIVPDVGEPFIRL